MGILGFPFLRDFRDPVVIIGIPFSTQTADDLASYPGSCGGGEKRAWYRPFAHALNYKLKNHVFVANDV